MALPTKQQGGNVSHLLPSELVDKCVGSRIWVRAPVPCRARMRALSAFARPAHPCALARAAPSHCAVARPKTL